MRAVRRVEEGVGERSGGEETAEERRGAGMPARRRISKKVSRTAGGSVTGREGWNHRSWPPQAVAGEGTRRVLEVLWGQLSDGI